MDGLNSLLNVVERYKVNVCAAELCLLGEQSCVFWGIVYAVNHRILKGNSSACALKISLAGVHQLINSPAPVYGHEP